MSRTRKHRLSGEDSAKIGSYIDTPCGHGFWPRSACTNKGVCQEVERDMRAAFLAPRAMGFDFVGFVMRCIGVPAP